jgi:hypothetical protein
MCNRASTQHFHQVLAGVVFLFLGFSAPALKAATATVNPPYTMSVFATSTKDYTQPDSIVQWHDHIIIGYSNGVKKDGSDNKSSTIVEYSLSGGFIRSFSVPGHNDGLRIIDGDNLWCLQNEDANPNLVVIDLESGHKKMYTFAPTVHGGGYDDLRVKDGKVFITASNPTLNSSNQNVFPALVTATLEGNMVKVTPVLNGQSPAIDIPTGANITLNLTDPDSLAIDPRGNIVLDDQADGQLIFIRHPLSNHPDVGRLSVTLGGVMTTVDDTAFATKPGSFMLVADLSAETVYKIESPVFDFEPGTAYSASDTDHFVGTLNLDTGAISPIVTGLGSARGIIFVTREDDENDHNE